MPLLGVRQVRAKQLNYTYFVPLLFDVNYLCRFRRLFLPVHLLFPTPLLSHSGAVAGDVNLQDDGVVDHPAVNGGGKSDRVGGRLLSIGD